MEPSERVELPANFEDAGLDHLVLLISDMLGRLIAHNDQIPLSPESLTRFHSRSAPNITILEYLRRIVKFTNVERSCLLLTLHYIDQICSRMPLFTLSSLTAHRFILASVAVSSKAFCDAFCTNNHYAKVGGISVAELNVLEREFLRIINWRLMPPTTVGHTGLKSMSVLLVVAFSLPLLSQCTRDVLQEYYVNLVRTHSSGGFIIIGTQSASSISSDSDIDSAPSRPMSPVEVTTPSTILIDTATLSPELPKGPTIEQNMAFAALQQEREGAAGDLRDRMDDDPP